VAEAPSLLFLARVYTLEAWRLKNDAAHNFHDILETTRHTTSKCLMKADPRIAVETPGESSSVNVQSSWQMLHLSSAQLSSAQLNSAHSSGHRRLPLGPTVISTTYLVCASRSFNILGLSSTDTDCHEPRRLEILSIRRFENGHLVRVA
jgi:hypothetical protein